MRGLSAAQRQYDSEHPDDAGGIRLDEIDVRIAEMDYTTKRDLAYDWKWQRTSPISIRQTTLTLRDWLRERVMREIGA